MSKKIREIKITLDKKQSHPIKLTREELVGIAQAVNYMGMGILMEDDLNQEGCDAINISLRDNLEIWSGKHDFPLS